MSIPELHMTRSKAATLAAIALAAAAIAAWAMLSPQSFIGFALGLAAGCCKSELKEWLEEG